MSGIEIYSIASCSNVAKLTQFLVILFDFLFIFHIDSGQNIFLFNIRHSRLLILKLSGDRKSSAESWYGSFL